MRCSLNEIEQTSRKAAKGCGLPWGVADEVGKACARLHAFNIDGVAALVAVLKTQDHAQYCRYSPQSLDQIWRAPEGTLSPIMAGLSLCDCRYLLAGAPIETGNMIYPILVAGLIGQLRLHDGGHDRDCPIRLGWNNIELTIRPHQLEINGSLEDLDAMQTSGLMCQLPAAASIKKRGSGRACFIRKLHIGDVEVSSEAWAFLNTLSHRTYVQATEENRMSGAGAGLNDND